MRTQSVIQNDPFIEVTRGNYMGWYVELFVVDAPTGVVRLFKKHCTTVVGATWLVDKYRLASKVLLKEWPAVYWR